LFIRACFSRQQKNKSPDKTEKLFVTFWLQKVKTQKRWLTFFSSTDNEQKRILRICIHKKSRRLSPGFF